MKKLPIGIQNFETLRRRDYLYVDKTANLLKLILDGERYFLSRPRRFGKSLTLSTLEAMFKGRAELFGGLAAEWWVIKQADHPAPVVRFDMSTVEAGAPEETRCSLKDGVMRIAEEAGISIRSTTLSGMFIDLMSSLYKEHGQVVVLIDEYDKPILDNLMDLTRANEMRDVLRSFYTTLKSCDEYLRFLFITGISRFSKMGVFSAMNNLLDISMDEQYGDIVGYTQRELDEDFCEWLEDTAGRMKLTEEELLVRLKSYYDGFSFDGRTRLYNPFSILNCLSKGRFGNFWYTSGSPTFIVQYMKEHSITDPDEYRHIEVSPEFADSHEIESSPPESFLYQSGYLTIEKWYGDVITLDYPNEEVRKSLVRMYLDEIYHVKRYVTFGNKLWDALRAGNIGETVELYNAAIGVIPYDDFANRNEYWYRSLFMMLLRGAGIISYAEVHTHKGRCDILIQFPSSIVVLEFKFATKSSEVMRLKSEGETQVLDKEYTSGYDVGGVKIISAVLVADDENRQLV